MACKTKTKTKCVCELWKIFIAMTSNTVVLLCRKHWLNRVFMNYYSNVDLNQIQSIVNKFLIEMPQWYLLFKETYSD